MAVDGGGLEPCYELLRVSGGADADARLRELARSHRRAGLAAHRSRSYRAPLGLVAWGATPLGVDLERIEPTTRGFGESICTPAERALFGDLLEEPTLATSLWSAKEALAKALGDALAHDPRRLESPLTWPGGVAGRWRARQLDAAEGHIAWLVWTVSET